MIGFEQPKLNDISIYLNPATDEIYIMGTSPLMTKAIQLYDLQGQLVKHFEPYDQLEVNEIQSGIYLLHIVTDNGTFDKKVVIE